MGLFDRLKARLSKTREVLSDGITSLFRGGRPVDKALLDEIEELLYASDLGRVAAEVMAEIDRLHKRGEIKGEDEVRAVLREVLLGFLKPRGRAGGEYELVAQPTVILIAGVNGSGKTTSIPRTHALSTASNATDAGSAPLFARTIGALLRLAQISSCSIAAARNVSHAPSKTVLPRA